MGEQVLAGVPEGSGQPPCLCLEASLYRVDGGDMTSSLRVVQESLKQCGGCHDMPCLPFRTAGRFPQLLECCWHTVRTVSPLRNCLSCSCPPGPRSGHLQGRWGAELHASSVWSTREEKGLASLPQLQTTLEDHPSSRVLYLHPMRSSEASVETNRSPTSPSAQSCFPPFLSPSADLKSTPKPA